jgi:glutaredoxin
MYTTAVCPYCIQAKRMLRERGVAHIEEIRVDSQPQERIKMMEMTGRRTVPQIFIGRPMWAVAMTWWRWTAGRLVALAECRVSGQAQAPHRA